jgi:predicted HicB family RNase H-like nuclease
MKDILKYKGFIGSVRYAAEEEVFYGKIEGIGDLITFEGEGVKELKTAFQNMVDEHIKDCAIENKPLRKSFTGSFNIRLTPKIHQKAAEKAIMEGITLNQLIRKAIEKELDLSE